MAVFDYKAYDGNGRQIAGQIEAQSREAALRRISDQGHYPVDAIERPAGAGGGAATGSSEGASAGGGFSLFSGKPRDSEITLFTQELSLLLASGQTLSGALGLIEQDTSAPRIQALGRRLRAAIAGGKSLYEALALEGNSFPPVYAGMVKAAEASGALDTVLARIAETREKEQKMRSRFLSALLYPMLLIGLAILTVVMMITVVVPQFKTMLSDQMDRLPASSAAVLATSDWLTEHGVSVLIGLALAVLVVVAMARQPAGRLALERAMLATPLVGTIMQLSLTARFCRTLGVLLSSGLQLPAALALTADVIGNERARDIIGRIGVALREGKDFTELLRQSNVFPPLVASLLRIGVESGTLSASGLRLAEMYETKLEISMQRLVTVLEPAIILIVSVFIGFIVLSIVGAIVGVYDLTGA